MTPHEFLKEIYDDFCTKHNLPKNKDGKFPSAGDYLYVEKEDVPFTDHQLKWLDNYIKLWEETNGGEDIDGTD
jgi:hypothetical protein